MPMPRSKCRYCRPAVLFLDDVRVASGFCCLLEEWDADTVCRKGFCRHYKEKKEKKNDHADAKN